MHVDQIRRVLQIEGTAMQIEVVKKRVGALLERVSSDNNEDRNGLSAGFGQYGYGFWIRAEVSNWNYGINNAQIIINQNITKWGCLEIYKMYNNEL